MENNEQSELTGTELLIVELRQELTESMPALIEEIDMSLAKMKEIYETLPAIVDEETKAIHFQFVDRCKLRLQQFKERRMPFTRKLNAYVKHFTTRESEVERYIKLDEDQMSRYARAALEKSRKDKERVEREQKAIDDKIALEGRIRELCRTRLIAMLQSVRENTGKLVQTVTKENLATIKKRLSTDPTWKDDMDIFLLDPPEWVTDGEQFIKIVNEELPSIKKAFLEKAKEVMTSSLTILETALTNKDEAASLQKAEEDRQKAEDARKAEQARKDIDAQQAIAQMDQEKVADPRVKVAMKMDILDNEAWPQIFRFWYVNDPDAKTKDLIKKTFLQMKTFCEKWGNDNGEFVTHESIEWVEDVKAKR